MKVFNINSIDVSGDIYRRIISDEKIRIFFEKLTKISREISKLDETSKEKEMKDLKPVLSNVSIKMNQLIRSGIDIDDKDWWLSEEFYSLISNSGNLLFYETTFKTAFLNVNFNGIKLEVNDFDFLLDRINVPVGERYNLIRASMSAPTKLVEDYSIWYKNNKNLVKDIEKAEKKYSSMSNETKKSVLKSQIAFMKANLERGNQMKQRIEFFEELTNDQITLIYEIFKEVKRVQEKYEQNRKKINEIKQKYEKLQTKTYERAFIKLIEQGTTQSEISTIITKMFKTIFVRNLMGEDITLPDAVPEKYLPDIDGYSIEWFIAFKEEDFTKLYNEIFNNFDLFYECFEERVLKKK